jgi:hypothetical protein
VSSAADLLGYRLAAPDGELAGRIRDALAGDDPPPPNRLT